MAMPAPGTPVTLPPPASSPPPACSFACARTLHAGFPSAFLWVERFRWALAGVIDETRPMDAMPLSFDTPAEDEIATSALTGAPAGGAGGNSEGAIGELGSLLAPACGPALSTNPGCPCTCHLPVLPPLLLPAAGTVSAYLPLVFMRDRHLFDAFYTFEGASEADYASWRSAMLWFFKKVRSACHAPLPGMGPQGVAVCCSTPPGPCQHSCAALPPQVTLRCGGCKPLLIKSPVHTARVALLLRLFPRSRFVYVHRDPLTVFSSAAHMADTYYWRVASLLSCRGWQPCHSITAQHQAPCVWLAHPPACPPTNALQVLLPSAAL